MGGRTIILRVYDIPMLNVNLISCSRLEKNVIMTNISKNQCNILEQRNNNELYGRIERRPLDGPFVVLVARPEERGNKTVNAAMM